MEDHFCCDCTLWRPRHDRRSIYGICTSPYSQPQQRQTYCKDSCPHFISLPPARNTLHDADRGVYPDHAAFVRAMFAEFLNSLTTAPLHGYNDENQVKYVMECQGQLYNSQGYLTSKDEVKGDYIVHFLGKLKDRYYYKIVPAFSIQTDIPTVSIGATTITSSHALTASDYSDPRQDSESL